MSVGESYLEGEKERRSERGRDVLNNMEFQENPFI